MKSKLKSITAFILSWIISFVVIYLFVFFGGYKLFETGDVILKEIGVSFIIGLVIFFVLGLFKTNNDKISALEKRIEELENNK
ncbi:MAG: hypothetical protein K2F65_00975 [Eubacterium sp.]|nr:hypothetical protein [Eubacterium sp.]